MLVSERVFSHHSDSIGPSDNSNCLESKAVLAPARALFIWRNISSGTPTHSRITVTAHLIRVLGATIRASHCSYHCRLTGHHPQPCLVCIPVAHIDRGLHGSQAGRIR